jgi:hypothetical protein
MTGPFCAGCAGSAGSAQTIEFACRRFVRWFCAPVPPVLRKPLKSLAAGSCAGPAAAVPHTPYAFRGAMLARTASA